VAFVIKSSINQDIWR